MIAFLCARQLLPVHVILHHQQVRCTLQALAVWAGLSKLATSNKATTRVRSGCEIASSAFDDAEDLCGKS